MNISKWFFSFFKNKEQVSTPTKRRRRSPVSVDYTDSLQCNAELTKGLYHNSYPGMKLSGAMAYTPIATPVWFMGVPVATVEDENDNLNLILKEIRNKQIEQFSQIHTQAHRDGTTWIFPFYSSRKKSVIWEFIQDETITDIVRDIITGEIVKIITDEEIEVCIDYNKTAFIRRQRIFTASKIEVKWLSGRSSIPTDLRDSAQRNILNIMPIPFSNNKDGNEIRGHSDYERIISDLKDYHDIDLQRSTFLAKFGPKMIINVQDVKAWLDNNGYESDPDNIDIAKDDIFINLYDQEKVEYIFPEGALDSYDSALKAKFRKLVEGSGIPEILWGTKVSGNLGSYEDQMDMVVKLVEKKREEKTESYKQLFYISLKLELMANMQNLPENINIKIEWDSLDAISEKTKAEIFSNYASGITELMRSAGITKEQLYCLYNELYPGITEDKIEDFKKGLIEMAEFKQFAEASIETAGDFKNKGEGLTQEKTQELNKQYKESVIDYLKKNGNGNGNSQKAIDIINKAINQK